MLTMSDLWNRDEARLRGYIARRVRERDVVDDLLQEIFIKAQASLHAVRNQDSVTAWLYRIAANVITDHYRQQKPMEEMSDEFAAPEPEPDYIGELASCLQPLIDDLPDTYRAALVLSEIEGLPQKEVADRLGLSLSGAKSRVQRGREKLRENLSACCNIESSQNGIAGYELRDPKRGCNPR